MAENHMAATLGRVQEIKQKEGGRRRGSILIDTVRIPRLYHTFLAYPVEKYPFSDFHITTITAGLNPL